ncbi:MAG: AraC family transcriptional regulator [Oscillospiraceae bacterium]
MENVHSVTFRNESKEELLPNFEEAFPYICSCAELDKFADCFAPWHWHKAVELFYIQKGVLEYYTPKGKTVFPTGSGGLVNTNILHTTKPQDGVRNTTQLEHIFDTSFISGQHGSLIEQKYVTPITAAPQIELIAVYPENPAQVELLKLISESFLLSKSDCAYELRLRAMLSEIWCRLLELSEPLRRECGIYNKTTDKIKPMMIWIHEHYAEKLTTADIADAAFISERECFRSFHECLHMTPMEYVSGYRLQKACHLLVEGNMPITSIGLICGLGSSSYFGKIFRQRNGCTPAEYRRKWQNRDSIGR